jgi:hypothetical protein
MNTGKWFFSTPLGIMELQISKAAVIIIAHVSNIRAETNNKYISLSVFTRLQQYQVTQLYPCIQAPYQNLMYSTSLSK